MSDKELKSTIAIEVDGSGVSTGVSAVKRDLSSLGTAATEAGKTLAEVGGAAQDGMKGAGQAVEATQRTINAFVSQIKNSVTDIKAAGDAAERYRLRAIDKGIPENIYAPYVAQLRAAQQEQIALANAAVATGGKVEMSARAMTNAMRGVPAQFTDIVTSLASGQAPLTVLMQQGGQLKDMFGGVGNALKALGGYVVGLINPLTITVGALGALGVAYYKGAQEADAFNKAIIATGNAAGTTSGRLAESASNMAKFGVSQSAAAEALAAFVATGQAGAANLERYATAAARYATATGTAISDTVDKFKELGKEPLTASERLNESMNYLTVSTYSQIRALDEQGKHTEAATLAQKAYADALTSRADEMVQKLGSIERGWKNVLKAMSDVGNAALSIGREVPLNEQADRLRATIQRQRENISDTLPLSPGRMLAERELERAQRELEVLNEKIRLENRYASKQEESAQKTKDQLEFDKETNKNKTNAVKLQEELNRLAVLYSKAVHEGELGERNAQAYAVAVEKAKDQYKEKAVAKQKEELGTYADLIKSIREKTEVQAQEAAGVEKLTKGEREQAKFLADLRDGTAGLVALRGKSVQVQAAEIVQAFQLQIALEKQNEAITKAEALRKSAAQAMDTYIKQQTDETAAIQTKAQKIEDEVAAYGLTKDALRQLTIARLEDQAAQITRFEPSEVAQREVAVIEARIAAIKRLGAAETALAAKDAAKEAEKEWKKTAEKINDSITDALMRGFESGKDFAANLRDTVANMFKTLVLRPTVSAIVNPVAQGITGALGFSGAANAATTATGLGNIAGGIAAFGGTLATGFMNTLVGSGMSAGLASAGAMITNGAWASGLGMAAGALGPLALGVAALSSLIKSNGGTPTSNTGNAAASYDARGNRIGYETFYGGSSANVDNTLAGLQATYQRSAAALGIGTVGTRFSFGGNTGRDGESPNFALGGSAGGVQFYQGETTASEAAISLAASRAVFAALQGSDLPAYLAKVFDGLTAGELSQDQITNTLAYAQTLKQVRDGLLETREPLQILKDNVAEGIAALGTSSETFKTDFVAAIDGGITPEKLAQWQGLQSAMTELAAASGKAADAVKDVGRSIADIANERQRLQDQLDELTLSSTELLAKQRNAIDASNRSLFDQVQVAQTARNVLEQRNELELQLLQLQGDSTELRKREMEAIDVSNRALFEQIQTAQTARTTLDQRNNLELQLLQLQGNTVELRKRELQALEPSNRVLQESIYALQDAKAAQDAYNTALSNAQSRMSAASSALESAQNAVDAIRSTGTDQYLSALDKVAQAQDAIAQAAQSASQKMVQLGQSLRDFVTREVLSNAVGTPSIAVANAAFARTLAQAKGGNADAIAELESRGRIAIDAARAGSTSSAQFQSIRNMVLQSISGVAATLPNATQAQGADLQQRLIDAQADLAEALRVANAIGAPLQRQQADLIARFSAAQAALASAQAEYAAASAVLEAIKNNTAQTAANVLDLNGNLVVQLHATAQSEITKLIKVIGDDTGLTPDLRALALMSAESVSKTIELIATSDISPDIKALALSASTSVTKTIGIIVSSSSMTDENKALALAVSDSIAKSIVLSATSNMAPDLKILALMATESVTKTVGVVVSSSLSDENKALALMSSNAVVKTIGVVVNSSSLSGENRALALMVSESVSKNIALAATSNMAPDLKTLALLESGSIAKAIALVANSSLSSDDKTLALMASSSVTKTIGAALGSLDSTALSLALAQSSTLTRTISAVGGALTDDQRTVLQALTGASSVAVSVSGATTTSVTFDPADPVRSVWVAIKTASEQNAGYAYGIHSAISWIGSMVSNMLNHISTVQIVFNRGDGSVFAKGGAFTNKIVDSPTLFDQSLMGEAGPEAIMPLKRGPDGSLGVIASIDYKQFGRGNDALVAEIRTLREENRAQASAIVGLNQRMTKLMERWDGNGLPSTRVEA